MIDPTGHDSGERAVAEDRDEALFVRHYRSILSTTDRLFAWLLVGQWLAAVVTACVISPRAWAGTASWIHPHIWAATLLGGVLVSMPVALAWFRPGMVSTRHVIAVSQMLMGTLAIHLTGGRIETHFHVFGSLAFLAFYRDWKVLISASAVVAFDHLVRGLFWPQSVYGTTIIEPWRWVEHTGWVAFEDVFLIWSCHSSIREMRAIAERQAQLERLHGQIEGVVERRTAELRESEARFRLLAENSTDIIARQSPEGAFLYISPACLSLLGYEPQEVIGHFNDEFVHHDDRPEVDASRAAILESPDPRTMLYRVRRKDGRYAWFESIARAVRDPKGRRVLEIHSASRDVTERVRIEEALRRVRDELEERVRERTGELERVNAALESQARELTRSNSELQQFAYVASHDLQEPLRMVSSYTQLLERRYKGRLDVDADEFIAYIVGGVVRMQQLIIDLLAYSRVGTKTKALVQTPCDGALERAIAILRIAVKESGATVTHDPLPTILVDEGQMVQVFQNLIGNAIKYRGEEPPCVHVCARRDGPEWHFAVRDNGIGIDPRFAERIFEIFQRLHTREQYPGTGIGLAICKKIVERLGGRIWVESQSGMGATFHFTIPAHAGRTGNHKDTGRRNLSIDINVLEFN